MPSAPATSGPGRAHGSTHPPTHGPLRYPQAPVRPRRRRRASNPKAPCPCGSGRRYKHCHGSGYAPPVTRPFEGLPGEADWVALRELVPGRDRHPDGRRTAGTSTLASVLPGGAPALVRANGEILLGVQLQTSSDDVSRDLGTALAAALEAPAGAPVDPGPIGAAGLGRPAAAGAAGPVGARSR